MSSGEATTPTFGGPRCAVDYAAFTMAAIQELTSDTGAIST
jgi:hypothetical protein